MVLARIEGRVLNFSHRVVPCRLIQNDASKSIQQLKDSKSKKSAAQQAADAAKAEAVVLAAQQAARAESLADIYAFEIPLLPGKRIRVGPIRHRGCEPLYREMGSVKQGKTGRTVQEGMAAAVASLEKDLRQPVWVGVVFSGEMAKVPCESRCRRTLSAEPTLQRF